MGSELFEASKWIKAQIENATSMIAWQDLIPLDEELPAVRYLPRPLPDVRGVSSQSTRILVRIDWVIAVVNRGLGIAPLVPLVDDVDGALHDQQGPTSGAYIECVRLEPFNLIEGEVSGTQWRHAGGIYRTLVHAL